MSFNKLTTQLQAFDKALFKKFGKYLQSGYFNVPPAALALFNYLEKLHPGFDEKKLEEALISRREPKLPNKNSQAKAGTELQKALEHFLALENWDAKYEEQQFNLLRAYKDLGLDEAFGASATKFKNHLASCAEKDVDYFRYLHSITEMEFNGFRAKLLRNTENDLKPVTSSLDIFYAVKKLRYHCELINRHQVLGTPYDAENTDELLLLLQAYATVAYPYVYLFSNVYQMLRASTFGEGNKYYQPLYELIFQNRKGPLSQGMKEVLSYLVNYCLFWNNRGFQQAGKDALLWLELSLENDLLIKNGQMQPAEFRNIVALAINSRKEDKWLKHFIEVYSKFLPQEHAGVNCDFALAQYYYYLQQFDKAMPLFQSAQTKDEPIFNMIVRRWQFMCMYEDNANNKSVLSDFLATWERQLHRRAGSLHQLKPVFAKFISYSRKLLLAVEPDQKRKTLAALQQESFFAGKNWFETQLKENRQRRQRAEAPASA